MSPRHQGPLETPGAARFHERLASALLVSQGAVLRPALAAASGDSTATLRQE
jgi:hypothetical protein